MKYLQSGVRMTLTSRVVAFPSLKNTSETSRNVLTLLRPNLVETGPRSARGFKRVAYPLQEDRSHSHRDVRHINGKWMCVTYV